MEFFGGDDVVGMLAACGTSFMHPTVNSLLQEIVPLSHGVIWLVFLISPCTDTGYNQYILQGTNTKTKHMRTINHESKLRRHLKTNPTRRINHVPPRKMRRSVRRRRLTSHHIRHFRTCDRRRCRRGAITRRPLMHKPTILAPPTPAKLEIMSHDGGDVR